MGSLYFSSKKRKTVQKEMQPFQAKQNNNEWILEASSTASTMQEFIQEKGCVAMTDMSNYEIWAQIKGTYKPINQHWTKSQFATASDSAVDIWSPICINLSLQLCNDRLGSDDVVTVI
eukprot:1298309-Ditylum_brightwellii.AAC.1